MLRNALTLGLGIAAFAAGTGLFADAAQAEYPERPITWVVPWGAGGGTDATSRMLAGLMEKELGVPVNVVNRDGGSGVVGHSAIATAEPDGYTIGTVTVEIAMMKHAGLTDLDYTGYTPLGLYNADPAAFHVAADSEFDTISDFLEAAKAEPGKMKSSGTGQGGIWHLAMAGLLVEGGLGADAVPWVPSKGSAAGLQDLVSGGVDIVSCSYPEAVSLVSAGKVKSLAVMSEEPLADAPDVPTVKGETGIDLMIATWRGVAGPAGLPEDATAKLSAALEAAWNSEEFTGFMAERGFGKVWMDGPTYGQFMADADAANGSVMEAAGLSK
ncbi:tripartite-type tricarboxylate transporter receptor subunit TctC [Aliiruegeria haliotis]|uniref:Tripartite-type tricarboxylate transporter receptor subunit TctC n=1 Tax=Aliiruegeria haliotis TaxID=1280846 RepID=A0A2T0RI99_9RHOB|nr:tripartite tricarboxylate transporter substrate binding protein [Aliiruegeria haliotis]PRY20934.1 tripartite-type tricarboxylate transporter receptor subunit TctC [Aliiruegeria haliotis]